MIQKSAYTLCRLLYFIFYSLLRLSYQIPLITGLAIIATIVVNILAFQYFMGTLFVAYTDEVASNEQK